MKTRSTSRDKGNENVLLRQGPRPCGPAEFACARTFPLILLIEMSLLRQGVFLFSWQISGGECVFCSDKALDPMGLWVCPHKNISTDLADRDGLVGVERVFMQRTE